jgi:hypothetical protein
VTLSIGQRPRLAIARAIVNGGFHARLGNERVGVGADRLTHHDPGCSSACHHTKGGPYRRHGKGRIVEQVGIRTSRKARLYALQFNRCHGEDGKAASLIVAPERACGVPKWTQADQL